MGQLSMEIRTLPGSVLSENQQLMGILPKMKGYVDQVCKGARLPNPSYPAENFADRLDDPKKAALRDWMAQAILEVQGYLVGDRFDLPSAGFKTAMTDRTMSRVLPLMATNTPALIAGATQGAAATAKRISDAGNGTKPWLSGN